MPIHPAPDPARPAGFTLLETLVALMILGLVVLTYLELFAASSRAARQSEIWLQAVAYAEAAMEEIKIDDSRGFIPAGRSSLEDGFERNMQVRSWADGVEVLTVTVYMPEGGSFTLNRLFEAR